ncbi:PDZ domain-containing protein [Rhizobium ruizarguesonis]|uniref:PDZ domain-containing protein n=2 Tax=Rhizobium ruizarguesonis TaxID=2081791 RepID=UPI001FDF9E14|nr:PDZ domain-containing protein [Rhizobium ruizarguesonis]
MFAPTQEMVLKNSYRAFRALIVVAHIASPFAGVHSALAATPPAAHAKSGPMISKALDALLLPINKGVIKKFKLDKGAHGVLVLSVKPGGVADKQGIKPGDVLAEVQGHKVHKPIDVDVAVRRQLKAGHSDMSFSVARGGAVIAVTAIITLESYNDTIAVSEISSWETDTTVSSSSYEEYVSVESTEIETSEESEETTVEEDLTQDESADADSSDDADDSSDDNSDDSGDDSSDDSGDDGSDDSGDDG